MLSIFGVSLVLNFVKILSGSKNSYYMNICNLLIIFLALRNVHMQSGDMYCQVNSLFAMT